MISSSSSSSTSTTTYIIIHEVWVFFFNPVVQYRNSYSFTSVTHIPRFLNVHVMTLSTILKRYKTNSRNALCTRGSQMANCGDPDQTVLKSDLDLHCFARPVCPKTLDHSYRCHLRSKQNRRWKVPVDQELLLRLPTAMVQWPAVTQTKPDTTGLFHVRSLSNWQSTTMV